MGYTYTTKRGWRIFLSYRLDVRSNELPALTGGSEGGRHQEFSGYFGRSFRFVPSLYQSPQFSIFLGYLRKEFRTSPGVAVYFPDIYSQPSVLGEVSFKEVVPRTLDFQLRGELSLSPDFQSRFFRVGGELQFWLNGVGRMLGVRPTHIYYDRYGYWDNFRLVLGLGLEQMTNATANFPSGDTTDQMTSFSIGLKSVF